MEAHLPLAARGDLDLEAETRLDSLEHSFRTFLGERDGLDRAARPSRGPVDIDLETAVGPSIDECGRAHAIALFLGAPVRGFGPLSVDLDPTVVGAEDMEAEVHLDLEGSTSRTRGRK